MEKDMNFSAEESAAARRLGISERFFRLLRMRGIKEEEMQAFLHPSLSDLTSPFDILGMKAAADRVRLALERGEKRLVFGDYECDGICAISIFMLA